MFMQSAAMALGFGSFFQYGKRKVSAMSNEEFNVLTPEALTSQLLSNINNMIPTVGESFRQMEQMNVMILEAMSKYFSQGVEFLDRWITGRGQNFVENIQGAIPTLPSVDQPVFTPEEIIGSGGQVVAAAPSVGGTTPQITNTGALQALRDKFRKYNLSQLQKIRSSYPVDSPNYQIATQIYNEKIEEIRKINANKPNVVSGSIEGVTVLPANVKLIQDKLVKYFKIYTDNKAAAISFMKTANSPNTNTQARRTWVQRAQAALKKAETAKQIFNVTLKLSRNYKELSSWWNAKPLI